MTREEYIADIKTRFGDQRSKDGTLIRDMEDTVLLEKMLERYPGDRDEIDDLDEEEIASIPEYQKSEIQTQLEQKKKGFLERVSESIRDPQYPGQQVLGVAGAVGGEIIDIAGKTLAPVGEAVTDVISDIPAVQKMAMSKGGQAVIDTTERIGQGIGEAKEAFTEAAPRTSALVEDVVDATAILPVGGAVRTASTKGVPGILKPGPERAVRQAADVAQAERDLITEKIAPGLNAKEVRKAMDEGRVTRGEQGFWFGKKPDTVEVTDRVKLISDTIQRRIPDASKLDDVGLNNRLRTEIENIAVDLEPKMREIRLRDVTPSETAIVSAAKQYKTPEEFVQAFSRGELDTDTVSRIKAEYGEEIFDDPTQLAELFVRSQNPSMIDTAFNAWERTKKRQENNPEFLEFTGSKRFQEIFETYLNRLRSGTGEKTLNDLWNIRKQYDASIPDRVKNASDISPVSAQIQKEMWLENRRILNDIINDSARGLGKESSQAFRDMSDLYTARENITAKAKLDTKGEPGLIQKGVEFIRGGAQQAVPFGAGALIF